MITKDYTIMAPEGLHARPATTLVRLAKKFNSMISLQKAGQEVRLNSRLNILSLSLQYGELISVTFEGEDELNAAFAFDAFFTALGKE
ncbi:HPr family phosphocarrier protein [Flavitalea flava]